MLHHLLIESAARYPDRPAVVDRAESMTYRELDESSARLADALAARGAGPGDRVGLYLDKSLHAIVAVWGVLRAGAAYVPLDVASPTKRVARIVENGELCAILTTPKRWSMLAPTLALPPDFVGTTCAASRPAEIGFVFETLDPSRAPAADCGARPEEHDPSHAAYILYTSGSTGLPKGVVLSHRAALSFVDWASETTQLASSDVVSSHAPLHFDLSVFDLFATCRAGATVTLVPPELNVFPRNLADWIAARRITVWYSVPSLLARLALAGGLERYDWSHLREIVFAGEVFPVAHLRRLRELIPSARYWNWYGPTETNVCTAYAVDAFPPEQTAPMPIGIACANSKLLVLDDAGSVCRRGETGELYVSGPGLMSGYQGMPEATAQALVARGEGGDSALWYRTGDLVREDTAGLLHLLGRRDGMIKSRGYRIELGEIESVLYQHPGVAEAAAIALPDEESGHVIWAVAVARVGQSLEAGEIRAFCAERLPAYMIPLSIVVYESLPRGSTGKVDRLLLREEISRRFPMSKSVDPTLSTARSVVSPGAATPAAPSECGTHQTEFDAYEELPHARLFRADQLGQKHLRPLNDPVWTGAYDHLRDDDPVLGLYLNGQARALPWWIMKNHHVANLAFDDLPVLVTLCEMCSGASAFRAQAEGRRLAFRLRGLYNATILLDDMSTNSLWSPFTGVALAGVMRGTVLERLPLWQCLWSEWLALHPTTEVLYGEQALRAGHGSEFSPGSPGIKAGFRASLVRPLDERLPHNTLVLGVESGANARAYPLQALARIGPVLNDSLGGAEMVVRCWPGTLHALAFHRRVADRVLVFAYSEKDGVYDEQTGSVWNEMGEAVFGPLAGTKLVYLKSGIEEWYGFAASHPDTEIFEAT